MSKLNVNFNIFSNSSSSIDQENDVTTKATTGAKNKGQTQPSEHETGQVVSEKQTSPVTAATTTQPSNTATTASDNTPPKSTSPQHRTIYHFHLPRHKSTSSSSSSPPLSSESNEANVSNTTQSTSSRSPTLQSPKSQSPKPQQQQQQHQQSSKLSPDKDERFQKLVKKTINKLKLSPAVAPVVAHTSPDSLERQKSHSQSHSQQTKNVQGGPQQSQSPSQNQHLATPLTRSRYNSVASCNSSSSDIFERSVTNGNPLSNLTNPETPFHYNIENYTNPILDTTAEILVNPNIQLDQVKLNCYCDDEFTALPSCDSFKGKESYFTNSNNNNNDNNNNTENTDNNDNSNTTTAAAAAAAAVANSVGPKSGGSADGCNSVDCKSRPNNQSTSSLSLTPAPPLVAISPTMRPRARSIISQSIISTLDNSKHNNNNNSNSNSFTTSGNSHLSKVKSSTSTSGLSFLSRPQFGNARSSSFAGNTSLLRNKNSNYESSITGGGRAAVISRKSSPKLVSLVTKSQSGANLATSPISNSSSGATTDAKYVHSPTSITNHSSNPPVIDFYSFADMCTHEDEELSQGVAEQDEGEERGGDDSNPNGEADDDDDDEIDPLDETNIQEFGFNSISSSGSGMISNRNGSISTGGTNSTMFTREMPVRRGSYATINAKDYIGVL
ncbi:hypothetical protein CANMA_005430 [Candida margitis]|uniref:uncharacterized protein n=1 Tax=Candida margitis TaxID=1775924 RepID=UPI0022264B19|nr:uncharacterized protein CANMA_005430 [Candida margitis]KAI5949850.1 hypothetical protein CANMA_005430 [Candida margitis]